MSAKLAALQALAAQDVAESGIDMNEAVKGGGGGRLLPEGYAFGRLVEYIEFGNQPQEYQGQAKDPAMEFTLGFALTGEGYQNDDGTPYVVRTYNTALSRNEKSRAFRMFKALNWKGTAKSFAQLLGETFLVKIKQVPKSKTDPKIVSRIDLDGFLPPLDPVTRQPYPIAEAPDEMYRLFLWSRPTKEAWDSLYIEGEYDGKSKNRIQEQILAALDFQGSPLQQLLMASGVTALPTAAPATPVAAPVAASPAAVVPTPTPAAPVAPVAPPAVPAAPLAVPAAASPAVASVAVPSVSVPTPAPVAVAPVAAPVGVPAPVMPAAPTPAVPSSPVLPA